MQRRNFNLTCGKRARLHLFHFFWGCTVPKHCVSLQDFEALFLNKWLNHNQTTHSVTVPPLPRIRFKWVAQPPTNNLINTLFTRGWNLFVCLFACLLICLVCLFDRLTECLFDCLCICQYITHIHFFLHRSIIHKLLGTPCCNFYNSRFKAPEKGSFSDWELQYHLKGRMFRGIFTVEGRDFSVFCFSVSPFNSVLCLLKTGLKVN